MSPNRLNIRLSLVKCSKLTTSVLDWVVNGIKAERREYEKTIIYCQSIENVSKLYLFLKEELGSCAYDPLKRDNSGNSLLIGMYHRKTSGKYKQRVINDLSDASGSCRVVVATLSLEMGVDISDTRSVRNLTDAKKDHLHVDYRDYKVFNESKFLEDVDTTPWQLRDIFDRIDDKVDTFYHLLYQLRGHIWLKPDVTASIRASKHEYFTAYIEENIDNPKGIWNTLTKLLPPKKLMFVKIAPCVFCNTVFLKLSL
eukprot:gene2116-2400_t